MEDLIYNISLRVKPIEQAVKAGCYDLVSPNNEIILPQVWQETIKPDWTITMVMWPTDRWKRNYEETTYKVICIPNFSIHWYFRRPSVHFPCAEMED